MKLIAENISKSFGDKKVLDEISFEVGKEDCLSFFGPSGEGKTTILRCLCGLENIDAGRLYWKGEEKEKENGKIGMVFQDYQLFPHLSIRENLLLAPLCSEKMPKEKALPRMRELLGLLGISEKEEAYPCQLSGGQKQRAAVARACMLEPDILCFDEPTAALDAQSAAQVQSIIKDLSERRIGIVVVSHDRNLVRAVSRKVFGIRKGKIEDLSPEEI